MVRAVVNRLLLSRRSFFIVTEREDLYQIGWLALNNCIKTFDESRGAKFDTYATTAIRNAVNKELHRLSKQRMQSIMMEASCVDIPTSGDKEMKLVIDALDNSRHFSTQERSIFWLRFNDEQHFHDIGSKLGVSRETVRRTYNKTLEKLKELMADE